MAFTPTIVGLKPTGDKYVLFKKCNLACEEQCGDCFLCKQACPDGCENGVETGYGHVWRISDRLPAFMVMDLVELYDNRAEVLQSKEGFGRFAEMITKLVKRSYPDVEHGRLHEQLDVEDWAVILMHFLSPLMQAGMTAPQPSTATPSETPKPRSGRRK